MIATDDAERKGERAGSIEGAKIVELPIHYSTVGITHDQSDAITNLCRAFQEWDGHQHPIERYRAQVERAIVREGIEVLRKRYP
jgi:hypothetical protein